MKRTETSIKILLFTDNFPYGKGEAFLETELKYLSYWFQNITILPLGKNNSNEKRLIQSNIEVLDPPFFAFKNRLEVVRKGIFNHIQIKPFLIEFFSAKVWKSPARLRIWLTNMLIVRFAITYLKTKKIRLEEYDIIYFYWGLRWSQIIPFVKLKNQKVIVRFHGSDLYEEMNQNYIPFRKSQISKITHPIFVSEMGRKYLLNKYLNVSENAYVSRLGTEDYGIGPYRKNPQIRIVSCSNLVKLKQVHLIAKALQFVKGNVEWTHIGEGPEKNIILSIISQLPKNVNVKLTGHLDQSTLILYYKNNQADVFINVSLSEGVPVSVMEALSFGIPIIASNVGGTGEIVDNRVGFLISPEVSPEELAAKIMNLVNLEDYEELRINARQRWLERCYAENVYSNFAEYIRN